MGKRVMVVQEHGKKHLWLQTLLEKSGYEVITETFWDILSDSLYSKERPDLVIVELHMDGEELGGLKFMELLQQEDPNVRVLVYSEYATLSSVKLSLERGACGFLKAPFERDALVAGIEKALAYPLGGKRSSAKRVMLLSKSREYQKMLEEKLEQCGCNVMTEMFSGESCLKMYERVEPDLVITDMELEGEVTGLYVLSAIRAAHPEARVMVFAGSDSERASDMIYDAFTRGACGILNAPFGALSAALETCWASRMVRQRDAGRRVLAAVKSPLVWGPILRKVEAAGYEITAKAQTKEECAALYREKGADVVIVGRELADGTGAADVVKAIREQDLYARVLIIDPKRKMDEEERIAVFEQGARGILDEEDLKDLAPKLDAHCLVWVPG